MWLARRNARPVGSLSLSNSLTKLDGRPRQSETHFREPTFHPQLEQKAVFGFQGTPHLGQSLGWPHCRQYSPSTVHGASHVGQFLTSGAWTSSGSTTPSPPQVLHTMFPLGLGIMLSPWQVMHLPLPLHSGHAPEPPQAGQGAMKN
jgi:hypothetical protein